MVQIGLVGRDAKDGDKERYEEAIDSAFESSFKPTIEDVSGSLETGKTSEISITIDNAKWSSDDTVALVSDVDNKIYNLKADNKFNELSSDSTKNYSLNTATGYGSNTLAGGVSIPLTAKSGCYSVVATIGGATVTSSCALTISSRAGGGSGSGSSATGGLSNIPSLGLLGIGLLISSLLGAMLLLRRKE